MNWLQAIFRPPPRVEPSLDLAAAADRELERILAFWLEHARDPAGGFWAAWRGRPQRRGDRGALLTSRILWTFSTACLRRPDPAFLAMAQWAFADLQTFHDAANGGLVWSRDPKRAQPTDRKEIYGQAFGIYGLSAYVRATGDSKALDQAIALYRLIERYARDHEPGGYFDTLQVDWRGPRANGAPGPKSQNTMLHLMEAYAGLLCVWPDPQLRDDLAALITLFCDRIIDPATRHLQLFLTADLRPASDRVSPGHDIECSWLLLDAAAAVGDLQLEQRCRSVAVQMATATLPAIGPDGGIPYEIGPTGLTDPHRAWWVMAEASVGFLNAFELSGEPAFRRAAEGCWTYVQRYIIDAGQGEWFARVGPDGRPDRRAPKIGFWKCPYHNARACMEIGDRARRLGLSPAAPKRPPPCS